LHGAADRTGDAFLFQCDPRRCRSWLPRNGSAAADPRMGHHAGRGARIHPARLVGGDAARRGHSDHGACNQPRRRRPARCARPEDEEVMTMALLEIENLVVEFETATGPFRAVDGVSLHVSEREVLAIVGESGSGKSVSMLAIMGLLPWTARVSADKALFNGKDMLGLNAVERRRIIGRDIAMIFQEPMASLNPCFTVGFQI